MKNKSIQLVIIISLTIGLAYFLSSWSQQLFFLISFGIELLGVFIGLRLLLVDQRSTNSKVAWIAIIFVIPVFGVISYLFFGRNPQNRIFSTNQNVERVKLIERIHQVSCESEPNETPKLSQRIEALTGIHAMRGNRLTLLTDGQETFSAILEALQGAKDHIHIQYYIFKQDTISTEIRDILVEKAKEGVTVRFLYDGFGSKKLTKEFLAPLVEAGVHLYAYDPIYSIWFARTANLRNHRKIIVVDGDIGFTGGLNVGDEYLGITQRFRFWRDTHLKMEGKGVLELQEAFLYDWVYMENRENAASEFISDEGVKRYLKSDSVGNEWIQVVYGGPYDKEKLIRDALLDLIDSADESVWIMSPYLVPDEESLAVLRRVAMSGINVKLLIPGKADMSLSFHGSNAYIKTLTEAGAEVYSYRNDSFIHGKLLIIDGKRAAIGTANFDVRSFRLNHELMVFVYEPSEAINKMKMDFENDLKESQLNTVESLNNKSRSQKIKETLASLFTPIL